MMISRTACVTLAGLFNALQIVDKELEKVKIAMIGVGAANVATARLLLAAGVPGKNIVMCDSKGILHKGRNDITEAHREKLDMIEISNTGGCTGVSRKP